MAIQISPKLKYEVVINEFLKAREWNDELDIDTEESSVTLVTGVDLEGGSCKLIIEAYDKTDLVDVFIYYTFSCKKTKFDQMAILFNVIHYRWRIGTFTLLSDGRLRWHQRVDFEGSQPTGTSIERMVAAGFGAVESFNDVITAVALTKQSAIEALEESDAAKAALEQKEDAEGPSEL
jgi:hypothetical protein